MEACHQSKNMQMKVLPSKYAIHLRNFNLCACKHFKNSHLFSLLCKCKRKINIHFSRSELTILQKKKLTLRPRHKSRSNQGLLIQLTLSTETVSSIVATLLGKTSGYLLKISGFVSWTWVFIASKIDNVLSSKEEFPEQIALWTVWVSCLVLWIMHVDVSSCSTRTCFATFLRRSTKSSILAAAGLLVYKVKVKTNEFFEQHP